jgi:thioredoxin 2
MPEELLIRCRACRAINRVPQERIAQGLDPICGRCKTPIPVREPFAVTDSTFADEVEQSNLPVLVDLWAEWCGPCRFLAPVVDQIAREMAGRLRVVKLNVDENQATAQRFRVVSIPTLLIFKDGREVDRLVGAQPKAEILQRIEPLLARSAV